MILTSRIVGCEEDSQSNANKAKIQGKEYHKAVKIQGEFNCGEEK